MRDPFDDPSVNTTAKPDPVDHRATPRLADRPHRHDGQPCSAHHHLVRRPDGQLVRITTLWPDPSLIRLPDGWTLTGETWA